MHISLTANLEHYVKAKVESGMYNNASEVVREALRHMVRAEETYEYKLRHLKESVKAAQDQVRKGEVSNNSILDLLDE